MMKKEITSEHMRTSSKNGNDIESQGKRVNEVNTTKFTDNHKSGQPYKERVNEVNTTKFNDNRKSSQPHEESSLAGAYFFGEYFGFLHGVHPLASQVESCTTLKAVV